MATDATSVMAPNAVVSWHVHLNSAPFCKSWSRENAEERARAYAFEYEGEVAGPFDYQARDCPYKQKQETPLTEDERAELFGTGIAAPMTTDNPMAGSNEIAPISEEVDPLPDEAVVDEVPVMEEPAADPAPAPTPSVAKGPTSGSIDLHEIVCEECGEPMDQHRHPKTGSGGGSGGGRRKNPAAHGSCPHCGGPLHWNEGGGKVNGECLLRQMMVEDGTITDPMTQRLPIATAVDYAKLGKWIEAKQASGAELRYGKMEAAGGSVGGTFAALRPKAPPRLKPKKNESAVPSTAEVAEATESTAPEAATEPEPPKETKADRRKKRQEKLKAVKR